MEQEKLNAQSLSLLEQLPKDMQVECLKPAVRSYVHQAINKIKTYEDFQRVTTGATIAYIPCAITNHHFNELIKEIVAPAILAEQETQELIKYQILINNFLTSIHEKRACFITSDGFLNFYHKDYFTDGTQQYSTSEFSDLELEQLSRELLKNCLACDAFWKGLYYCYRHTKDKELFSLMQILFDHGLEIEKHYYNLPDDCSELKAFLDKNKSHISA